MGGEAQPIPDVLLVSTERPTDAKDGNQRSQVGMWRTIGALLGNVADKVLP